MTEQKPMEIAFKQATMLAQGNFIHSQNIMDKKLLIEQLNIIKNNCQTVIRQLKNQ